MVPETSESVATTVVTAVPFSAMAMAAVLPPPFDMITGVPSLLFVTVTAMAWVSVSVPSETCTTTS